MLQGAPALRELDLLFCGCLESLDLHYCTALERVDVVDCCLIGEVKGLHNLQSLRNFDLSNSQFLKSLELHTCTAVQELSTWTCGSLKVLEGLESLSSLRRLTICNALELLSGQQGYEQCPRLEGLRIDDFNALTTSFFRKQRASLKRLCIVLSKAERLTEEQESELLLLSSLEDLDFSILPYLEDLPAGLHSHPSLKRLVISRCPRISRLPEKGLPPSLEKLETRFCSDELNDQCRMLASSKLRVQTLPHMT
ncbi:unnamed protein product [Triticum turgidum subsp. durum]|uniref:Uncharacterized protein n=1 Tax=Triticum turgidum subsp. durum TaxID=4567 RepID=A0A9R0R7G6_TRITD|nr:unnamed protein product [Triticum turgidum subsp. durum]